MKAKNLQSIICLIILFLFANHAWAADWIYLMESTHGTMYYDKTSIKKINKNIIRVWVKRIYNEDGKTEIFSLVKSIGQALDNPDILSHDVSMYELDCVNEKSRFNDSNIYDKKGSVLYSRSNYIGEWNNIIPDSVVETLKIAVCKDSKTSKPKKK